MVAPIAHHSGAETTVPAGLLLAKSGRLHSIALDCPPACPSSVVRLQAEGGGSGTLFVWSQPDCAPIVPVWKLLSKT